MGGSEDNPANLMYGGVLTVGIFGALLARFQPEGILVNCITTTGRSSRNAAVPQTAILPRLPRCLPPLSIFAVTACFRT
jgi:hypothetical protein